MAIKPNLDYSDRLNHNFSRNVCGVPVGTKTVDPHYLTRFSS